MDYPHDWCMNMMDMDIGWCILNHPLIDEIPHDYGTPNFSSNIFYPLESPKYILMDMDIDWYTDLYSHYNPIIIPL